MNFVTAIQHIEQRANTTVKKWVFDFLVFGLKQAYACLFGGVFLGGLILSIFFWPDNNFITRYDFLFLYALAIQTIFLLLKWESWEEARVIFAFHVVGTAMEVFKTHMGSWIYPEENFFRIGGVPLFSGFMYSAVGSYIARAWRIFDFSFTHYPPRKLTFLLAALIYINFFTHHFIYDVRPFLFLFTATLFFKTRVTFKPYQRPYWMPLMLGFTLVAFFIWVAENVGTFGRVWMYPNQRNGWEFVPIDKMGSWFLLMIISFVLVTSIHPTTHKDKDNAA